MSPLSRAHFHNALQCLQQQSVLFKMIKKGKVQYDEVYWGCIR